MRKVWYISLAFSYTCGSVQIKHCGWHHCESNWVVGVACCSVVSKQWSHHLNLWRQNLGTRSGKVSEMFNLILFFFQIIWLCPDLVVMSFIHCFVVCRSTSLCGYLGFETYVSHAAVIFALEPLRLECTVNEISCPLCHWCYHKYVYFA